MTKKRAIIISIIISVLILLFVLLGAIFCVRQQDVVFIGDRSANTLDITNDQLIESAGIKNGRSIFTIDKDGAIANIEHTYPYIKVIQINTVSPMRIEICVRERVEMFYAENISRDKYYILDEEMKVLRIDTELPTGLSQIIPHLLGDEAKESILGISGNTVAGDFLSNEHYRDLTYNTFVAIYKTVMIDGKYLDRDDIKGLIIDLQFGTGYTEYGSYDRVIMSTNLGFTIDIGKPDADLERKVNTCFSAIGPLVEAGKSNGSIRVFYYVNDNGEELESISYFESEDATNDLE